jgi:hypothetical protein
MWQKPNLCGIMATLVLDDHSASADSLFFGKIKQKNKNYKPIIVNPLFFCQICPEHWRLQIGKKGKRCIANGKVWRHHVCAGQKCW